MTKNFDVLKPGDVVRLHSKLFIKGHRVAIILSKVDSVTRNGIYTILAGEEVITCVDTAFVEKIG